MSTKASSPSILVALGSEVFYWRVRLFQGKCLSGLGVSSQPLDPSAVVSSSMGKERRRLFSGRLSEFELGVSVFGSPIGRFWRSGIIPVLEDFVYFSVTQASPLPFQLYWYGRSWLCVSVHAPGILLEATHRLTLESLKVTLRIRLALTASGDPLALVAQRLASAALPRLPFRELFP